jgi:aminocarboxymuconate-semialdehyde decarboxylase
MATPDAGTREAERAIKNGALGVQIFTNVNGKPLDRPEFEQFWAKMNDLQKPVWIHPARGADFADYADESKSLYEIWWAFGWSYETAAAMARLVFSKTIDKYPDLKLIVHHFGGIVPMLEGRIGPGWDQLGNRTTDEDYISLRESLKKRPLDYFKQDFYADTAAFSAKAATVAGLDFYPTEKILFASDCPFDPEKGPGYIRETIKILDGIAMSKEDREKIYYKNFEALTGVKFVK